VTTITYAGVPYWDRIGPLLDGTVSSPELDLRVEPIDQPMELFRRMATDAPYEMAEMSLSTLIVMLAQGDDRLVAIPVFPSRAFRHSQVYVHADAGVQRPEDLVGRLVGIPEYQMTAALWVRAFLQHEHGVEPRQIRWRTGGLRTTAYEPRRGHSLPEGVELERIPEDQTLEGMLDEGALDALVTARAPASFGRPGSPVRRLFPDYPAAERAYYQRTGHFPIMHTVVLRRDVYERDPQVAVRALELFEAAKSAGRARLRRLDVLAVMHPWIGAELDGLDRLFGGDAFAYGVPANRRTVEAMAAYSHEQGLSARPLSPEDIFAPEAIDWTPRA
jgi:4,5-dihydroxyphthalate decarboxylase